MRVTSAFWVAAYIRRCEAGGAFAVVARKGAAEAGAIHIRIEDGGGTVRLYVPAPQSLATEMGAAGRRWLAARGGAALTGPDAAGLLEREARFDPDLWVVDVDDRAGRSFLAEEELARAD